MMKGLPSLWQRAYVQNVRLRFLSWQYTTFDMSICIWPQLMRHTVFISLLRIETTACSHMYLKVAVRTTTHGCIFFQFSGTNHKQFVARPYTVGKISLKKIVHRVLRIFQEEWEFLCDTMTQFFPIIFLLSQLWWRRGYFDVDIWLTLAIRMAANVTRRHFWSTFSSFIYL